MARKPDPTTNRQRGIKYVGDHMDILSRQQILSGLMVDFGISLSYAKTIYAAWRKEQKEQGALTAVFSIRDHKDGETVDPFVVRKHVSMVKYGQHTSIADAQKAYKLELQERLKLSKQLK